MVVCVCEKYMINKSSSTTTILRDLNNVSYSCLHLKFQYVVVPIANVAIVFVTCILKV